MQKSKCMIVFFSEGKEKAYNNDILSTKANAEKKKEKKDVWSFERNAEVFLGFYFGFFFKLKPKRYGGVRRSRNILDQTESYWKNVIIKPWNTIAQWHCL